MKGVSTVAASRLLFGEACFAKEGRCKDALHVVCMPNAQTKTRRERKRLVAPLVLLQVKRLPPLARFEYEYLVRT